jgi:hypothetical protein
MRDVETVRAVLKEDCIPICIAVVAEMGISVENVYACSLNS